MYSIVKSIATLLLPAADTVRVQYSDRVSELSVSCGEGFFTRMLGRLLLLIKSDLRSWKRADDIAFIQPKCWGFIQTESCAAAISRMVVQHLGKRETDTLYHRKTAGKSCFESFILHFTVFFSYCPYQVKLSLDIHTIHMFLQNSHLLPDNVLIDIWGKQRGRGQKSWVHGGHDSSSYSSDANDRDVGGCEVLQSNGQDGAGLVALIRCGQSIAGWVPVWKEQVNIWMKREGWRTQGTLINRTLFSETIQNYKFRSKCTIQRPAPTRSTRKLT